MKPYVTVSFAQSLDGRIATKTRKSQWIGGPESLRLAHELRRDHDAILVGISTVIQDDPLLTCRLPEGGKNPIRIILDTRLRCPVQCKMIQTVDEAPVWIFHGPSAPADQRQTLSQAGAQLFALSEEQDLGDLHPIMEILTQKGVKTLFVEGGASIITSFLRKKMVDRLLVVTAPFILGSGIDAVGDLEITELSQALKPQRVNYWTLGDDHVSELLYRGDCR